MCLDETNKQLIGEVCEPLPARPGQVKKIEHEYEGTLELGRTLGVTNDTAGLLKQKLTQAMRERDQGRRLASTVQVDDAYLGDAHPGGKSGCETPGLTWVNTILGNVKRALNGTYHAFAPPYAARSLAEFQYRFNRRYDFAALAQRLQSAVGTPLPLPHPILMSVA